jgi:MoaA/NifB/PqqE/SkfB family radical SAM enzyme
MDDYSFCLFRIPENGGRVIWQITNSCNYSCVYCIFSAQKRKIEGELNTEEAMNLLDELKSNNFRHLKITGGEPFVRKDLIQIMRKASELGLVVDVSTNASLITKEKAVEIKDCRVGMVHVSIDGDEAAHDEVRGKGTFARTVAGVRNLVENGVYVRIGTLIYKKNEHGLEGIVKLVSGLGANEIIFSFMEPVGRMKGDTGLISTRAIPEVKAEIEAIASAYKDRIKVSHSFTEKAKPGSGCGLCPGGTKFLFVDNFGRVAPCTWVAEVHKQYISEKTLKTTALKEILDSGQMKSYSDFLVSLTRGGLKGCPMRMREA